MYRLGLLFGAFSLFSLVFFSSCGDKEDNPTTTACQSDFDQSAMFRNIANNIILPAYENLQNELNTLATNTETFLATPNQDNLETARNSFRQTYLAWQKAAQYEFGPAETVFLRNHFNNFPADTEHINNKIMAGNSYMENPDGYDKGLPAMDYLLFGLGNTDEEIISFYSNIENNAHNKNHNDYLKTVVQTMQSKLNQTIETWETEYKNTFINNTGTADGTSLSLLINCLNQNYELIKREKIGIPAGIFTSNIPQPNSLEAIYSRYNLPLVIEAVKANQQLYLGMSEENGIGFDDYLTEINAQKDNTSLDAVIQVQYQTILETLESLDTQNSLLEIIGDGDTSAEIQNVYTELVRQIYNIKTDMPSVLCVAITYVDNSSDSD